MRNKSEQRIKRNHIKRNREMFRHIVLFFSTIFVIAIMFITFGSFLSKAQNVTDDPVIYKYFTSIEIQPGDSLYAIAEEYMDVSCYSSIDAYIAEVAHINSLENDTIHAGQYIIVPYHSTELK